MHLTPGSEKKATFDVKSYPTNKKQRNYDNNTPYKNRGVVDPQVSRTFQIERNKDREKTAEITQDKSKKIALNSV